MAEQQGNLRTANVPTPEVAHSNNQVVDRRRNRYNNIKKTAGRVSYKGNSNSFKGETAELDSNVFQLQEESQDPTQYKKTKDALERYSCKTYTSDMRTLFEKEMLLPTIAKPMKPAPGADEVDIEVYVQEKKYFSKELRTLSKELRAFFSVIYGQCSQNVRTKLQCFEDLEGWKQSGNCEKLLEAIEQVLMKYEHQKNPFLMLYRQQRYLTSYKQKEHQTLSRYYDVFNTMVEGFERFGGSFVQPYFVEKIFEEENQGGVLDKDDISQNAIYRSKARGRYLAMAFMMGGRTESYEDLITDLNNDFLKGHDYFPKDLTEAFNLMSNWSLRKGLGAPRNMKIPQRNHPNVGFLQNAVKKIKPTGKEVSGRDGKVFSHVECYRCGQYGHYSNQCPVALYQQGRNVTPASLHRTHHGSDNGSNGHEETENIGFAFMQHISFLQKGKISGLSDSWILLDTQSNCDIFCNGDLLQDVRDFNGPPLKLESNGGTLLTSLVGDIPNYGTVWYNPDSLANILSFANVRKKFNVTMSTGPNDKRPTICVHKNNGDVMKFIEHPIGLYVHCVPIDSNRVNVNDILEPSYNYSFLNTQYELEKQFTKRQVQEAKTARSLYINLGRPSQKQFKRLITSNSLKNCPVTLQHIDRSNYIYGDDVGTIKGKTTRTRPRHIDSQEITKVPDFVRTHHNNVTLCIDIFYVNGLMFFHTIARTLQFRTVHAISSRGYKTILSCFQDVANIYVSRDFVIERVHAVLEFECIRPSILPTQMHIVSQGEHVPEVERSIRTIKDRCRATIHGLPFQYYPKLLLKGLVYFVCMSLNWFPAQHGVSDEYSPSSIVAGTPPLVYSSFSITFGTYAQVHDDSTITNTTAPRTTGAIALYPSNSTTGWHFLSLSTGALVVRRSWTVCVVTQDVIERVHALAKNQSATDIQQDPIFEWPTLDIVSDIDGIEGARPYETDAHLTPETQTTNITNNATENMEHTEDENEENTEDNVLTENKENEISEEYESNTAAEPQESEEYESNVAEPQESINIENAENREEEIKKIENEKQNKIDEESQSNDNEEINDLFMVQDASNIEDERSVQNDNINIDEIDQTNAERENSESNLNMDQRSGKNIINRNINVNEDTQGETSVTMRRYNMRRNRRKLKDDVFNQKHYTFLNFYNHKKNRKDKQTYIKGISYAMMQLNHNNKCDFVELHSNVVGLCFTQMSARKGIKMFGEEALAALSAEYAQLDSLSVFTPRDASKLNRIEKKEALRTIDLIKKKRCGKVKGRSVVDGRDQREQYSKAETSSPAITFESLIATFVVDAYERRDVATSDVSGAFLKAEQKDYVLLRLTGEALKAILRANPNKYEKYVTTEGNVRVLYVQLLRAMYGTLTAAIAWYTLFAETLMQMGFTLNPYDLCVANKVINGAQFTICWYVDDVKLSHRDHKEVTKMLKMLEGKFGTMNTTRGSKHTYLGVNFEIKQGRIELLMPEYIQECIDSYGEAINSNAVTPANKNLFEVDENAVMLDDEKVTIYHHIVQKLLHVCKRARVDIQVAIAFMCTRVRHPSVQDWQKLRRLLQYLCGTINMRRIISLKNFSQMEVYTDASHATHLDMRGHTGGCIVMGDGVLHCRSSKQKLNTKSSTESELVGGSDYLPYPVWLLYFYEAQGYRIAKKIMYQDNQSTMKFLINGRKSCGKQSRHVNIRFFWIADRLKEHDITVEYCPTDAMLADFYSKPLQGGLFKRMRDVVMGLEPVSILKIKNNVSNMQDKEITPLINGNQKDKEMNLCKSTLTDRKERVEKNILKGKGKVSFSGCVKVYENGRKRSYADTVRGKILS